MSDSFTLAISHRDGEAVFLDCVREVRPPFSPESVVSEFAALLKAYCISRIAGDRYAGEWPREQFRKYGIAYDLAQKPKSDLYRDLLPMLNSRRLILKIRSQPGVWILCVSAASSYSIISSARERSEGGTVRPSALAVLRLITSSNLVALCTGRSAGFSPLRMRST